MTAHPSHFVPADAQPQAVPATPSVRCRRVEDGDIGPLSALLAEGFPARSATHWQASLETIATWTRDHGLPGTGFVLVDGDRLVGCLLTLYSPDGQRCSFSSWYVADGYRRFGTILVSAALRDRSVTYLNISSEKATRPIIEAQGFRRYSDGVVLGLPLLSLAALGGARISRDEPGEEFRTDPAERRLMQDHAALGCLCFWCLDGGRAYPIVAARRLFKGRFPVAQIIFCPADMDWQRLGGAVGRALAGHGLFLILIDAAGPIPGLTGRYFAGRMPKYRRGTLTPRLGDLAYTEAALIGT